eukprot:1159085-Pelagomonas_calceolata.AAC.11
MCVCVYGRCTQWEKLDRVGEGTYGVVFRAKDRATGGVVAIKKIRLESDEEGMLCVLSPLGQMQWGRRQPPPSKMFYIWVDRKV